MMFYAQTNTAAISTSENNNNSNDNSNNNNNYQFYVSFVNDMHSTATDNNQSPQPQNFMHL